MKQAVLLLDIGNTNIKVGLLGDETIKASYVLSTMAIKEYGSADDFGLRLETLLRREGYAPQEIREIVVCSVVPPVKTLIDLVAKRFFNLEPVFVPEDLPVPLINSYEKPEEVGADRLVLAYAARLLADPADFPSIIVADYGTATTFDCVKDNVYLGGLICPGVLSSARALSLETAKLPAIFIEQSPLELDFGRSTVDSLRHGLVFGFAALTEGIVARLKAKLTAPVKIYGTGGLAAVLAPHCPSLEVLRLDLVLDGLAALYLSVK